MTAVDRRHLPRQVLRSLVAASVTVGLSGVAHAAGGAAAPSPGTFALLTALSALVSLPVLLRWTSPAALIPLLAAVQGGLHPAFVAFGDDHRAGHAGGWSLPMVAAHLAAAVLGGTLLVLADRALAAVAAGRSLRRLLHTALPAPLAARPALAVIAGPGVRVRAVDVVLDAPRRGPPRNG